MLKKRLEPAYPGGLDGFRNDWRTCSEDDDLVRLNPDRIYGSIVHQLKLRDLGLKAGRDYAVIGTEGRPEAVADGIIFERRLGTLADEYGWQARAGEPITNVVSFPRSPRFDKFLARGREHAPNRVLAEERSETENLDLSICVNPEGCLVFQRLHDWADPDASNGKKLSTLCRIVQPARVPEVLVELMVDRFECEDEFAAWLKTKGIDSELRRSEIG